MAGAVVAFSVEYFGESTERRGVGIYDEETGPTPTSSSSCDSARR